MPTRSETLSRLSVLNLISYFNLNPKWMGGECFLRIPTKHHGKKVVCLEGLVQPYMNGRCGRYVNGVFYYYADAWVSEVMKMSAEERLGLWEKYVEELKQ